MDETQDLDEFVDEYFGDDKFEPISPDFYKEDYEEDVDALEEEDVEELSSEFVNRLIEKIFKFMAVLIGHDLHTYQKPLARRIIVS